MSNMVSLSLSKARIATKLRSKNTKEMPCKQQGISFIYQNKDYSYNDSFLSWAVASAICLLASASC